MKDVSKERVADGRKLSGHRWTGARSIGLAQELNEQVIELCCEMALEAVPGSPLPLVAMHRDLWGRLDPISRKRLSRFPFVLIDLRFGDVAWWHTAAGSGANARDHFTGAAPATRWDGLSLETLMFGWQAAREDRSVASMLFAMPRPVADYIATLTMQQVRMLAVESAQYLRVRWDNDPRLWRELLIAAREDEAALEVLRREAMLRFCGELICAKPLGTALRPLIEEIRLDASVRHRR